MAAHPEPTHVLVHISDTHLLAEGALLYDAVDTEAHLRRALDRLENTGLSIDAIVHTGDIADLGEADAYVRVRELIEPFAARLECELVWVPGNHDIRQPLRANLLGEPASEEPIDTVTEIRGLRIIGLDTSVPARGHGEVSDAQLDWLRELLAKPAPAGTVLAMHHPPIETVAHELRMLQLHGIDRLADIVRGSDVRHILAGHYHYPSSGTLGGVPVAVAPATSYTVLTDADEKGLTGVDGDQAFAIVHVTETDVLHTRVAVADHPTVSALPYGFFEWGAGKGSI